MDNVTIIASVSIITAGSVITLGTITPAIAQMFSIMKALDSIARQPDEANTFTRNLFVGMAMIESLAIYCLVITIILIFTNPYWEYIVKTGIK